MRLIKKNYYLVFIVMSFQISYSQEKYNSAIVMFYNVENLFDTIETVEIIDGTKPFDDINFLTDFPESRINELDLKYYNGELLLDSLINKIRLRKPILNNDYTYKGVKNWNKERYNQKITNITTVIKDIGRQEGSMPVVIGICEVENKTVLEDLCTGLNNTIYTNYSFIHYNSFDARGIDVALLYNANRFKINNKKIYPVSYINEAGYLEYSRDILVVEGVLDGEEVCFLVNHWPSRLYGEDKTKYKRAAALEVLNKILETLTLKDAESKIIVMGDFNEDPIDTNSLPYAKFYNPAENLFKKEEYTYRYGRNLHFFDQQLFSAILLDKNKGYYFESFKVFTPSYLFKGDKNGIKVPYSTYTKGKYTGGYSDHFSIYSILKRD